MQAADRWRAFWQLITKIQKDKLDPAIALRNSIGITVPIAIGIGTGAVASGLAIATGALNVAFTDSHTPYVQRSHRMLLASVMVGLAVFVGSSLGDHHTFAVLLTMSWAFIAGLLVALSTAAADVGVITLVTLLIYSASPMPESRAAILGLLAFCGGILQTLLAIALWPIRRHAPERRALGNAFLELGELARSAPDATQPPPATSQMLAARDAVDVVTARHSVEAERYRALLTQAERIRLTILTLTRLRVRLRREQPEGPAADIVDAHLKKAAAVLSAIGSHLLGNGSPNPAVAELNEDAERLRAICAASSVSAATLDDARYQVDALNGQLRAAADLATAATPRGEVEFGRREARRPIMLRLEGTIAILRANLTLRSAALRHALRLAVCVGVGVVLGRSLGWERFYWLPMTIAIILKPDFTGTFSRGVLRLAGTFVGLILSTVLFHVLPFGGVTQVALIAALSFALRWLGPANYGIFVIAVTALVVVLVAISGTSPSEVIAARGLTTAAGGVIALVAYAIWPTWERLQVPEAFAQMLDAYRQYFRAIREAYVKPEEDSTHILDAVRSRARLARTNLEASVDRLSAEPGMPQDTAAALNAMMATSHRLVHAMMALEAGLSSSERAKARDMFHPFANAVELTMYYLAAAMRGGHIDQSHLPDLREAHHALVHSSYSPNERYALVNVETDRITNALNTIAEQVLDWIARTS
jgi:uncharacterized membrane protein YccC